jgi:transcriptional regulator with XRE-family HTH domain
MSRPSTIAAVDALPTRYGARIQERRRELNLSQESVVAALTARGVTIARSYLSMVETGANPAFSTGITEQLALVLEIPVAELEELAEESRDSYKLAGLGPGITNEHRHLAALLAHRWTSLDAETLRRLAALVEPPTPPPRRGRRSKGSSG